MRDVNILVSNGINVKASMELFGDMATYDEMINTFLVDVTKKLAGLAKYKEASDMPNYGILAHSLKSDAKYFGFEKLAELSYKHELAAKANNPVEVNDNYEEFIKEANRIVEIVKKYVHGDVLPTPSASKEMEKIIIVADDSDIVRSFVEKIFKDTYKVIGAHDGNETIKAIEDNASNRIMALLLDINMPVANGFVVLEYIKANNLFGSVPVAIITGDESIETTRAAFTYQIFDILRKPFNEQNIKAIVDKLTNINSGS